MEYSKLVSVYSQLEETTKRLEMTGIIAGFLKEVPEKELAVVLLLLEGRVFPPWSDKELGIGYKLVIKALSNVSGVPEEKIEDLVRETGDTGRAAEKVIVSKVQTTLFVEDLTVAKIYENLDRLASLTGKGSQERKISLIKELLSFADPLEGRYIVRTILEELRLGVGKGIIRDAIAGSFEVDPRLVERAYNLISDYGEVASIARSKGDPGLEAVEVSPGRPMECMLAQKAAGLSDALEKLGEAVFEIKYDGARVQVHKKGSHVELYTRRLENVTKQFPEIVAAARDNVLAKDAVIEGELVAIKSASDRDPRPFQDLSRRIKRKYDIRETIEKIPVEINLFDIIYADGKDLMGEGFMDRRKALESVVRETGSFRLAEQLITGDLAEAERFYRKALDMGHEGVMAKNPSSPYQPGSRVGHMYKVKPIMETLDLVITGATWGEGRRANWLGSFLLSVVDHETGELLEIGRMGTGLTDEQFKEMTETLKKEISQEVGKEVRLKPRVVVEVAYEEIQKSPTYGSGYALRFPRLVRMRTDKSPEEADSIQRVEELLKK